MSNAERPGLPARPTGLDDTLGITYEKLEPEEVVATMPVTERHRQPLGYLHGGASVVLAESVASVGGFLHCSPGQATFGMEINANHLRPKRAGQLRAVGQPLFLGRSTQVWEVKIYDEAEQLICAARCTLAVVTLTPPPASPSTPNPEP
jgi:1,4-dihydroxy-2-naphthoyl-CoA hydrolase